MGDPIHRTHSPHHSPHVPWNNIAVAETLVMIEGDTASTEIVFDGNPDNVLVHTGTPVTDEFGTRSCSMVFSGDNTAFMLDENGEDVCELRSLTARATEFKTKNAMPAVLPETSGYTYCAELSADGIGNIRFEKPVVVWVENFLDFAAGTVVPSGYYDRAKGEWVASENGRVVRLLGTGGIVDSLDADGDGLADDLDGDGSLSDEIAGMENRTVGDEMWRVEVTHFTPWDYNWPWGPPEGSEYPDMIVRPIEKSIEKCEECPERNVTPVSLTSGEDIPIPGAGFSLHYDSARVESLPAVIDVAASGQTVPSGLDNIKIRYEIAGLVYEREAPPFPEVVDRLVWDGTDFRGQPVRQPISAHLSVGFTYDAVYYRPGEFERAFGQPGGAATANPTRGKITLWESRTVTVNHAEGTVADGWSLSAHHQMNPSVPSELLKGDGSVLKRTVRVIDTVAGNGDPSDSGRGGSALFAGLNQPADVKFDAEGGMYVVDFMNHRVKKVDRNGVITEVAGNGTAGFSGDGGHAVNASLYGPAGIGLDSRGNLYIADQFNHRIRKVDREGIITTIAGTGDPGYNGDEMPAVEASLFAPTDVSADESGNIYIADEFNHRIRKIDTGGVITTLAGDGIGRYAGDGGRAAGASFYNPCSVEPDGRGNIYVCDFNNHRIRMIDPSGGVRTVAGNGSFFFSGDCVPAAEAGIGNPVGLAFDRDGNMYVASYEYQGVFKIGVTGGILTALAGSGGGGFAGDGGPASGSVLDTPTDVAVGPDGGIYVADRVNNRIRRIAPEENNSGGETVFAEDGIGYVMSETGRHERTVDLETGVALLTFGYDAEDLLISITDRLERVTYIHRSGGVPISVETPDGIVTGLTVDADNQLSLVTYPDNTFWDFGYQNNDGLLTAVTQPNGNRFDTTYDDETGRVDNVSDLAGGGITFSRVFEPTGDVTRTVTDTEGEMLAYADSWDGTGALTTVITEPDGEVVEYTESEDELSVSRDESCGMLYEMTYDLDSEHDYKYLKSMTVTSPAGLTLNASVERVYGAVGLNGVKP